MKDGKRTGRMGERFKPAFFKEVVAAMKKAFPNIIISSSRLNSKRSYQKKKWELFLKLYGKTGYSFNQDNGWFYAEPQNQKNLKEGPLKDYYQFKDNAMPYYRDLEEIFSKLTATGRMARRRRTTVNNDDDDNEIEPIKRQPNEEEPQSQLVKESQ